MEGFEWMIGQELAWVKEGVGIEVKKERQVVWKVEEKMEVEVVDGKKMVGIVEVKVVEVVWVMMKVVVDKEIQVDVVWVKIDKEIQVEVV